MPSFIPPRPPIFRSDRENFVFQLRALYIGHRIRLECLEDEMDLYSKDPRVGDILLRDRQEKCARAVMEAREQVRMWIGELKKFNFDERMCEEEYRELVEGKEMEDGEKE